jgi:hypothetical protein
VQRKQTFYIVNNTVFTEFTQYCNINLNERNIDPGSLADGDSQGLYSC